MILRVEDSGNFEIERIERKEMLRERMEQKKDLTKSARGKSAEVTWMTWRMPGVSGERGHAVR
jgi:hypothetical protein